MSHKFVCVHIYTIPRVEHRSVGFHHYHRISTIKSLGDYLVWFYSDYRVSHEAEIRILCPSYVLSALCFVYTLFGSTLHFIFGGIEPLGDPPFLFTPTIGFPMRHALSLFPLCCIYAVFGSLLYCILVGIQPLATASSSFTPTTECRMRHTHVILYPRYNVSTLQCVRAIMWRRCIVSFGASSRLRPPRALLLPPPRST